MQKFSSLWDNKSLYENPSTFHLIYLKILSINAKQTPREEPEICFFLASIRKAKRQMTLQTSLVLSEKYWPFSAILNREHSSCNFRDLLALLSMSCIAWGASWPPSHPACDDGFHSQVFRFHLLIVSYSTSQKRLRLKIKSCFAGSFFSSFSHNFTDF